MKRNSRLNKYFFSGISGQTFIEYTMMIGIVLMAIIGMQTMIGRGSKGMIKVVTDQIGNQEWAEQDFNKSYIQDQTEQSNFVAETRTQQNQWQVKYLYNEETQQNRALVYNLAN